jgi:hypothetical protein
MAPILVGDHGTGAGGGRIGLGGGGDEMVGHLFRCVFFFFRKKKRGKDRLTTYR